MGQKIRFFKKQSRDVTENKVSAAKNKAEQTQKQSREVVENAWLWKKQSQKQSGVFY
ncbi:MAG TPA: hypothetical protein VFJ52_11035 [Terriglobia bacterium]|nr:hypothetical protein [Terriglobia bacterium]